jgi:hypothetical protein
MPRYKIVDGKKIKFTKAEETARDKEELDWSNGAFDRAISKLRNERNNLLKETDYLALSDNTMSDEIKKYRKDLRDITDDLTTEAQVKAVEFPTKPN